MPAQKADVKATTGHRSSGKDVQLTFDFGQARHEQLLTIVAMDSIHGKTLCNLILTLRPQVAVDLRHAVRFDLPGTNRHQIFSCFNETRTFYTQASIPWHELKPADFMTDRTSLSHRLHHEILERSESALMLLLPSLEHSRYLRSYLNRKLSEKADQPWRIEEVA
ncbi:hypothetical protein [Phyllobacterium ifriqiyense]|uniref:hypothetical protein n=1 Tax=Phyllobacterium ifriqiyense TaxID=314238 RepID=UPI003391E76D